MIRFLGLTTGIILLAVPDKGGLPLRKVDISEPEQTAVIAFDGKTEVLYVSSILRPKEKTKVLEILPLPAEPKVDLADAKVIERTAGLYNAKVDEVLKRQRNERLKALLLSFLVISALAVPGIVFIVLSVRRKQFVLAMGITLVIAFLTLVVTAGLTVGQHAGPEPEPVVVLSQDQLGPHSLTVVKAEGTADITSWIEGFILREQGDALVFDSGWRQILEAYVRDGYRIFALDVIDADPSSGPVAPLRYSFPAKALYFPLRISSRGKGVTDVALFLLTPDLSFNREGNPYVNHMTGWYGKFPMTAQEIESIDGYLGQSFPGVPFTLRCVRFIRPLEELKTDFVLPLMKS